METLDSNDRKNRPRRNCSLIVWNLLTALILLSVVCVVGTALLISANPYLPFNPFPPPTLEPTLALPNYEATSTDFIVPTRTPTDTPVPTATKTPKPSTTPRPTNTTFTLVTPSSTPTTTPPPEGYPYKLREGSPSAVKNLFHPELGCNWMGVGGQVVGMNDAPVTGLIVRLGGTLPGITFPQPMLTLTGVALNYGPGGYEFPLAEKPIASKRSLWLQLLDQSGLPLSEKAYFDTYESCDKNLILINFKQVR